MKNYLFIVLMFPAVIFAQVKKTNQPGKKNIPEKKALSQNTLGGFSINGNISGYPDGTVVNLLNPNTGAPEATTKLEKGKFLLTGKMNTPDFKVMQVNNEQRYITLFLDNSNIKLTAEKDSIPKADITGSSSQNDFIAYSNELRPYEGLLNQQGNYSGDFMSQAVSALDKFIAQHPSSYITPLAIYRFNQLTANGEKMEEMYNNLSADIRSNSPIATYIVQAIAEYKKSAIGKPLTDFSQPDTSGNIIKLSSLKGKYVLVDFWASWCGPCRAENPNVVRMYNKYKDKNFTVIGVSLDQTKQAWLNAINADALTWTHVSDLQGWHNSVAQQFQIQSIPQNFLLDPAGNVIAKNLRGAALEYKLTSLLQ